MHSACDFFSRCLVFLFNSRKIRYVSYLLSATTEKRKDLAESSTWALSNFLKEVNQSKENLTTSKNCSGEVYIVCCFILMYFLNTFF